MATSGRLEELPFPHLLQVLLSTSKSGKLTLSRDDTYGVVLLRRGRILYAASNGSRGTLENIHTCEHLIEQGTAGPGGLPAHGGTDLTLLAVLLEMGVLNRQALEALLRQQIAQALQGLMGWQKGFFRFERLELSPLGGVGLEFKDLRLEVRPEPSTTSTAPDAPPPEGTLGTAPGSIEKDPSEELFNGPSADCLGDIGADLGPLAVEISLALMRYASRLLNRCLLFVTTGGEARVIGHCGIERRGSMTDRRLGRIRIPLSQPSVLAQAASRRKTYQGPLGSSPWHDYLIGQLGGAHPGEVIVAPVVVGESVPLLLYGDNLPQHTPITSTGGLNLFLIQAGQTLARRAEEVDTKKAQSA